MEKTQMTKAQEIEALRKFVGSLPEETYLRDFFGNQLQEIESVIMNDFTYDPVFNLRRIGLETEVAEKRLNDLQREEGNLNRRVANAGMALVSVQARIERARKQFSEAFTEVQRLAED